jgi:methylmalonyl-CoA/ethylmalonyl-CoA epimerase
MLEYLKFHHIGYAVKAIPETAKYYVKAGWTLSETLIDEIQNTHIAFLTIEGFPLMELVAPVNEDSPVVKTLDKMGITPYHICYETDDIEQSIFDLKKQRFIPLLNPVEAVALGNRKICYLFNPHVGLIELVNKNQ